MKSPDTQSINTMFNYLALNAPLRLYHRMMRNIMRNQQNRESMIFSFYQHLKIQESYKTGNTKKTGDQLELFNEGIK
jgi:hypothetical protein